MVFDVEPLQGSVLLFAILPWVSPTAINILPLWGKQTLRFRTLMVPPPGMLSLKLISSLSK